MNGDGWHLRRAVHDPVNRVVHLTLCRRDLAVLTLTVRDNVSTVDGIDAVVAETLSTVRPKVRA